MRIAWRVDETTIVRGKLFPWTTNDSSRGFKFFVNSQLISERFLRLVAIKGHLLTWLCFLGSSSLTSGVRRERALAIMEGASESS